VLLPEGRGTQGRETHAGQREGVARDQLGQGRVYCYRRSRRAAAPRENEGRYRQAEAEPSNQ